MVRPLDHWKLLWQRKLRQTERNKLHEPPQIAGAVAQQILRSHSFCQRRRNAPLAITERLYRAVRWIELGSLSWMLLGLLVCAPIVRAQIAGFDSHAGEIFPDAYEVFLKVGADREVQKRRRKVARGNRMKHIPALYLATAMALQGMTKKELEALKLRIEEKRV